MDARRRFTRRSLLAGALAPANSRINMGFIGVGGMGSGHVRAFLNYPDVRVVAICDVRDAHALRAKQVVDQRYGDKSCATYRDFRELLDRKDIDSVIVATGDRWHATASMAAAEAGKDVYSEKPCGLTIDLCQRLDETFKKTGRIFQAGTQRRSVPNFATAVEIAQSGKLGKLETVYASAYIPTMWRLITVNTSACS